MPAQAGQVSPHQLAYLDQPHVRTCAVPTTHAVEVVEPAARAKTSVGTGDLAT